MSVKKTTPQATDYQSRLFERINRLAWDEAAQEDARRKGMFAQARRRAKEKPVSLPKLAWMEKSVDR